MSNRPFDHVKIFCGSKQHENPKKFNIKESATHNGYFYSCENYLPENIQEGEQFCNCRLSPIAYEEVLMTIDNLLGDGMDEHMLVGYKGKTKKKHVEFEIFEDDGDVVKAKIINQKN